MLYPWEDIVIRKGKRKSKKKAVSGGKSETAKGRRERR
jgi:hypothetical protein